MKNSKKSKVIIVMGPPGAGKGTQASLLSEKLGLYRLESSKVIEENVMAAKKGDFVKVGGKKYSLLKEQKLWKTGLICTSAVVGFWMKEKIKKLARANESILLEGTPRTPQEAEEVAPILKKLYGNPNIKIILLELNPETSIWRNSHRRICELLRHPILYNKETIRLRHCTLDGSKLIKRKSLDDPKIIRVRLREYKEKTLPLVTYFEKQGLKVIKTDGSSVPAVVFRNILKALGTK